MKSYPPSQPGYSPRPLVIYLQPGQQLTIIGADSTGAVPAGAPTVAGLTSFTDSASPSRRSDSASPSRRSDQARPG